MVEAAQVAPVVRTKQASPEPRQRAAERALADGFSTFEAFQRIHLLDGYPGAV